MNCRGRLITAAKELNHKLGLDPPINLNLPPDKLKELLQEAGNMVWPEDNISQKTLETLKQLGIEPPKHDDHGKVEV